MFGSHVFRDDEFFMASLGTILLPVCVEQPFDLIVLFPNVSREGFGVWPHSSNFRILFEFFRKEARIPSADLLSLSELKVTLHVRLSMLME